MLHLVLLNSKVERNNKNKRKIYQKYENISKMKLAFNYLKSLRIVKVIIGYKR